MHASFQSIAYQDTGYFTPIVADYLSGNQKLLPFLQHSANWQGLAASIESRKQSPVNRALLVEVLTQQYASLHLTTRLSQNLALLKQENTFTVTTAHQPNIFTGPLYFIYKCMHAIRLAESLQEQFPDNHFVPVYYMGSEDADLEEIGELTVGGIKLAWNTPQTGAVGRMKVDQALLDLITQMEGQTGVLPFGKELSDLWRSCFTKGKTISQAMLEMVHHLMGDKGLVVLIPDNPALKSVFTPIVLKELFTQFSHSLVEATNQQLAKYYKVQAAGRNINLFYLIDDKRERIEIQGNHWVVPALGIQFTQQEMEETCTQYPERFSANVILRGLFQEMILPNVAFIGGGGELAYWLELKQIFTEVRVPFPVLLLRNSFVFVNKTQAEKWIATGFPIPALFKTPENLIQQLAKENAGETLYLTAEIERLTQLYQQIYNQAIGVDKSLSEHVNALKNAAIEKLQSLEKKMLRAEKRKYAESEYRIQQIRSHIFPNNQLQERVENMALWYATWGKEWLEVIYQHSQPIAADFRIIILSEE